MQAGEPVLVEALVAELAVEGLDVSVLIRLAGFDEEQLDASRMSPGQHGPAAEFLAVIGSDRLGQATCRSQLVKNADELLPTHRAFRDDGDRFVRRPPELSST